MVTELLPKYVSASTPPPEEGVVDKLLSQIRALYSKNPVVDSAVYNSLDKVGPAKRADYDAKLAIMVKHQPTFADPLSIEESKNQMAGADATLVTRDKLLAIAADLTRLATFQAAQAFNMLKCSEDAVEIQAGQKNEAAISIRNDLKALKKQKKAAMDNAKAKIEVKATKIAEEKIKKLV